MSHGKRFGGVYSPGGAAGPAKGAGADRFRGRRPSSTDVRAIILFILPTPLLAGGLWRIGSGDPGTVVPLLGAYGLLMTGAWMLAEGQKAERAYDERPVARPPALPRKIVAAGLAGLGVGVAALFGWGLGGVAAAGFAALTAVSHLGAFGLDPLKAKGVEGLASTTVARVIAALEAAEERLHRIEAHARTTRDDEIEARVARLNGLAREMIAMIERDPGDMDRARRYLGLYLDGAEAATRKYAENGAGDPALRTEYLGMLDDLGRSFERGRETLTHADRTDLEIEIEVLRERLARDHGASAG